MRLLYLLWNLFDKETRKKETCKGDAMCRARDGVLCCGTGSNSFPSNTEEARGSSGLDITHHHVPSQSQFLSTSIASLQHLHLVGQSYTRLSSCLHCFSMNSDTCVTGPNVRCVSVWTDLAMLGRELRGRGVVKGTTLNSAGHILSPHALNSTADSFLSWIQSAAR